MLNFCYAMIEECSQEPGDREDYKVVVSRALHTHNSLMSYQNTTTNNNLDEDKYALTSSPPGVLEFSKPALFFGY